MSEQSEEKGQLSRTVSPNMLAIYGIGTVLGAGIYVVIGKIIGDAGALAPVAFLVAASAAAFTAFSYAELSSRVPSSGGSAAYVATGFDRRWLTVLTGWAVIATGLVSAATITTGFVGYANVFVDVSTWVAVPLLVGTLTLVAAIGVKQSAWFMGLTTAAGVLGLLYVCVLTAPNLADYPQMLWNAFQSPAEGDGGHRPQGLATSVLLAAFLAFYAFIGFEDLVTLAEEAEQVETALPRAITVTLVVSLIFYLLVSAAAVATVDAEQLANSRAPLVDVVESQGRSGYLLGAVSLLIIINGALAQIVMGARVVHDMGTRRSGAPSWLAAVNKKTRTPLVATVGAGAIVLTLALFFPTETLASWTSYIILMVFFAANASLLKMKMEGFEEDQDRQVKNYSKAVPILGMISAATLIIGQLLLGGSSH